MVIMNVAFIPVRGGSKSIPLKNIKLLGGKPLVYWTIKAACACEYIEKVYVATDSEIIKGVVEREKKNDGLFAEKLQVIGRSEESSTDSASTESAMLEFALNFQFDNIVLIQATSPLLTKQDLERGFEIFEKQNVDSVFSAVRQKRFCWDIDEEGYASPINYDPYQRPRRQNFEGYLVENGAFYITSKNLLLKYKNRISGRIKAVEMEPETFFEIDEPSDWVIIEALLKNREINFDKKRISNIRLFLTDCDGCLTDGGMYYSENGDELKKFNARDGKAFELLRSEGILTGIITGETVELNQRRAKKLNVDIFECGCKDKLKTIKKYCEKYNLKLENVLYIGDDVNDLEAIKKVGLGCCPADALDEVKKAAVYISEKKGGYGAIRECAELILKYIKNGY